MLLSAPANLNDFDQAAAPQTLKEAWDARLNAFITRALDATRTTRLFHPLSPPSGAQPTPADTSWAGFPRGIEAFYGTDGDPSRWPEAYETAQTLLPFVYNIAVLLDAAGNAVPRLENERFDPQFSVPMFADRNNQPDFGTPVILRERQQDEYLEWHTDKDENGRVRRISFTAEGPEYWDLIVRPEDA